MFFKISKDKINFFQNAIINWFQKYGREFPWRYQKDPYIVFISEIMLQKTTSDQVFSVFYNFINRFPSISSIVEAKHHEIEKFFKSLGLGYKKTKVIKTTCEAIVHQYGGLFPKKRDDLIKLSGIGLYTANAILCFAYEIPVGILDTNIIRIFERVFGIKSKKSRPRTDLNLWNFATEIVPIDNPVDYNYGLLDLGSLICTSRIKRCGLCPVKKICLQYNSQEEN